MSTNSSKIHTFFRIITICAWVVVGFFLAQFIFFLPAGLLVKAHILNESVLASPLGQLLSVAIAYSFALAIVVFLPQLFTKLRTLKLKSLLGLGQKLRFRYLGWALLGYIAYAALTYLFSTIARAIWPHFDPSQTQNVGFDSLSNGFEYGLAFVAFVLIAPIVEELLFRGYLFGKLRAQSGFWLSTIITSVVFGFIHLQWNVGIDVFALSLVLCFLREKTGALWAGIALHMLKNTVAYSFIFLFPDVAKNLLQ